MNNFILPIIQLPGTGKCFKIYTKVFQNVFAMGKWNITGETGNKLPDMESRKPRNVEVQIMEEHILRALLPIQKVKDNKILK